MLKMPHIGSKRVHLHNQTHMQSGSRCIWICIDVQYTPLHANITYLICFMCFWCFGRRSAALMVHGYITCPEQTEYSKKTAYYFWSLGRCETWCKHVQTALIVCSVTAHNRRPLKKGIFRFFHLFQTYPLIFHGVPMRTWPISELQSPDSQIRSFLCRSQYIVQRCPSMTVSTCFHSVSRWTIHQK